MAASFVNDAMSGKASRLVMDDYGRDYKDFMPTKQPKKETFDCDEYVSRTLIKHKI